MKVSPPDRAWKKLCKKQTQSSVPSCFPGETWLLPAPCREWGGKSRGKEWWCLSSSQESSAVPSLLAHIAFLGKVFHELLFFRRTCCSIWEGGRRWPMNFLNEASKALLCAEDLPLNVHFCFKATLVCSYSCFILLALSFEVSGLQLSGCRARGKKTTPNPSSTSPAQPKVQLLCENKWNKCNQWPQQLGSVLLHWRLLGLAASLPLTSASANVNLSWLW